MTAHDKNKSESTNIFKECDKGQSECINKRFRELKASGVCVCV